MIVWGLFDSGNGSYKKVADKMDGVELYSIGLDIQNQNNHFINLDLADYSYHFTKKHNIFNTLDKLPKPDLIIASPPCESWSVASAMKEGNACWKQQQGDSLFEPQEPLSRFTVRDYKDYDDYQFKPENQIITRLNGELTIFHTIEIIKRYQPEFHIIENPAYGRIWDYIEDILGFKLQHKNLTYYNNYNDYPVKKPTRFSGNVELNLKTRQIKNDVIFGEWTKDYNKRSNIPRDLVEEILTKILKELN